jgi:glucan phosphorylase
MIISGLELHEPRTRRFVRMAYLAIVASYTVNGVAAIHSEIIKNTIFKDFAELWPEKFQNKTNGVTPRRWLAFCNAPMRELLTKTLGGDDWINNLRRVEVRLSVSECKQILTTCRSGWPESCADRRLI